MKCTNCVAIILIIIDIKSTIAFSVSNVFEFDSSQIQKKLEEIIKCNNVHIESSFGLRDNFWALYNFIQADIKFKCYETVTYTTHTDFSFLNNVEKVVDRWNGPISIAVYAPGTDFDIALRSIAYLRNCGHRKVKEFITWHIFFNNKHFPNETKFDSVIHSYIDYYNCSETAPYLEIDSRDSYRRKHGLTYPINVARNIARVTACTHFIFPCDIELYPIHNFPQKFINMIVRHPRLTSGKKPHVYVLPVFEVLADQRTPETKTELQKMLSDKTALPFHVKLCNMCHSIPHLHEWIEANETSNLNVFTQAVRKKKYAHWEPFYVGTNEEPLFDERLTWEGQSNKISQAFSMCLLDYDFLILDNAFLVHKPGIKQHKEQIRKYGSTIATTNKMLRNTIKPELIMMYGNTAGCKL